MSRQQLVSPAACVTLMQASKRGYVMQGTQKIQTAYSTIDTDAQTYVASMLEVHHESRQLRENLRKQHRIWMDFYATVFRVCNAPTPTVSIAGSACLDLISFCACTSPCMPHAEHDCLWCAIVTPAGLVGVMQHMRLNMLLAALYMH